MRKRTGQAGFCSSSVAPFVAALRNGDLETMLASLAANVVLVADGGNRPGALLRPVEGAEPVACVMINAIRRHGVEGADIRPATVNGLPGFVRFHADGHAQVVLAFGVAERCIQAVFVSGNPDKLRHLHRSTMGPPSKR